MPDDLPHHPDADKSQPDREPASARNPAPQQPMPRQPALQQQQTQQQQTRSRRDFLRNSMMLAAVAGSGLTGQTAGAASFDPPSSASGQPMMNLPKTTRRGDMLYRQFGSTGVEVSLIGLGGFHIGMQETEAESVKLIRSAIDRGITFLDNCWDYHDGLSEIRMGTALAGGYRDKIFLMTKIDGRTKKEAAKQIDESLRRLNVEMIDLMQIHEVIRLEDPDRIFGDDGAAAAMRDAKQAGKIRFMGFTGHKDPLVHLRMIEESAAHDFPLDAVQMPINVMDAHFRSFELDVLPRLVADGIAPIAMKTFGDPHIFDRTQKTGAATPVELLHYSMSRPVATVVTGIKNQQLLDQAIEAAKTFDGFTQEDAKSVAARVKPDAGKYELYKTTAQFDGTAANPRWLG